MIKNNKFIIPKILVLFLAIGFATLLYSISQEIWGRTDLETKNIYSDYEDLSSELDKAWRNGYGSVLVNFSSVGDIRCSSLRKNKVYYHSNYLNCNPLHFQCLLESNRSLSLNKKKYELVSFLLDRRGNPIVSYQRNSYLYKVKLFDTCRTSLLPENKYSSGLKGEDFIWDNINQKIYIDKNYRTNLDVEIWSGEYLGERYLPNTSLDLQRKKKYCQSIGGQLLQSHVLDAASFFFEEDRSYFNKYPYPWSKRRRELKKEIMSRDCSNMYTKECIQKRELKHGEAIGISWMGIYNVLGNYPEVVDNKFVDGLDLHLSSSLYGWNHFSHQVGERVKLQSNLKIKAAFRCMFIY